MSNEIDVLLQNVKKELEELINKQKASENFNIFSTLGVELLETRHSKFIAELLNPNGTHGCGSLFLERFLLLEPIQNKLKEIDLDTFCKNVKVETEQFHIVEKNQSYIDIVIETKDTAIVIENKIYAPDQHKQLYRYHKAKYSENYKNIIVIYLTLDGKLPTEQSLNNLSCDDIELISYEVHITDWLMSVIEIVKFDNIRNIIDQYLSTLELLTNKNSKEENMKIADKLMESDSLQTAIKIANALPRAKAIFEMQFYKKLQTKLLEDLKDFRQYDGDDFYWSFDEDDIQWIMKLRKPNTKQNNDGFNGIYLYKELKNEKYLFLKIGDNKDYRLYCECFLNSKNDNLKIQRIKKTDFKETNWIVQDDYQILIEGESFPEVSFGKKDDIYTKSNEQIEQIIIDIADILSGIISSRDFQELEEILENY
ncbi:MAG: hypothetical protein EOM50_13535 [Erysipelotrichia bacterium]|nr:hypothetical protein [Erysipelotrichia bacterium]